jgi:hypothetical protein
MASRGEDEPGLISCRAQNDGEPERIQWSIQNPRKPEKMEGWEDEGARTMPYRARDDGGPRDDGRPGLWRFRTMEVPGQCMTGTVEGRDGEGPEQ